jgi:hypothetical protein
VRTNDLNHPNELLAIRLQQSAAKEGHREQSAAGLRLIAEAASAFRSKRAFNF